MRSLLTRILGNKGERYAARYLRKQGYRILCRQHNSQFGEIDLIALDNGCIVFVEVKTRTSLASGHPVEAVNHHKQQKLTQLALAYLKRHNLLDRAARFDIVALIWPRDARRPQLTHYKNAFEPTGSGQMFS